MKDRSQLRVERWDRSFILKVRLVMHGQRTSSNVILFSLFLVM